MKPTAFLRRFLAIAGSAALTAPLANAADITWDANGATAAQTDGLGAWLNTNQWWNGSANVDWTSGDSASFGNAGAGGAVTLASPTTAGSLAFNYFTGTYTLGTTGQALTINNGITKIAGSGILAIAGPVILGGAQTWTNNSPTGFQGSGAATVNNGGFNLTFGGTGSFNMAPSGGNTMTISGGGGIIKNGTGDLNLDSNPTVAHSFTGDIVVNGGSIGFQTAGVFTSKNTTLNGGYLGGRFSSNVTWTGGLGTGANQIQITGGVSGFSGESNSSSTFTIGTALSTLKWGASGENGANGFFNPTALLLNGSSRMNANGTGPLNNGIDVNGSNRTFTSNHTNWDGSATTGGVINGAIVNTAGTAAGIIRTGIGNLSLIAANTYNGATTIQGGTLTLRTAGTANSTSALNLSGGGILRLVNTAQVNRFADGVAITSNGGGITYENTSGANVYTETLGSLGMVSGQTNIVLSTNQASTGSQTLTLGGLTRTGTNTSAVTFSAATTGPQITGNKNMIVVTSSGTTTAGQIIGAWATTGTTAALQTDYAVYNGNYVTAANITANNDETTWTSSDNINLGVTATLTAARTVNTLRYSGAAANLVLAGNNLETGGLLNGGSGLLTITSSGGALTTASGGGNLYVTTGSAGITSAAGVNNNGGTVNLVKSGSGTLILSAANNTYSGTTTINAGTLQVGVSGSAAQLNSGSYAGNIFIGAGAALTLTGNSTNTLSGNITGDGVLNILRGATTLSGNNSYTGKTTFGLVATNAVGNTVTVSSFNSVVGGTATSSLGAPTTVANGTIDWGGSVQVASQINFTGNSETTDRVINILFNSGGSRTIDSSGGTNALLKFTSAFTSNGTTTGPVILQGSTNGEIVQGLPFGFTNLTKNGAGTWTLGGVVGNTGITTVSASGGTLALQNKSSLLGGNTANWTAAKVVVNTGGTLALNVGGAGEFGTGDVTTLLTNIGGVVASNGLRAGSTIGFNTTNASGGTFTIANNIANTTGTGGGAVGLTKLGTGTLNLTGDNSYTGATSVNAGTLAVTGTGEINSTSGITIASGATFTYNSSTALTQGITNNGGTIKGTGAINVSVGMNSTTDVIAPGNSPGIQPYGASQTWSGLTYEWETNNFIGTTAGTDFDQIAITGNLSLTGAAPGSYILDLISLTSGNLAGDVNGFVEGNRSWDILTTTGTISGFDASFWTIDHSLGLNTFTSSPTWGGNWTITGTSNTLVLNYTYIPEPGAALLGSLGLLTILRRRRR